MPALLYLLEILANSFLHPYTSLLVYGSMITPPGSRPHDRNPGYGSEIPPDAPTHGDGALFERMRSGDPAALDDALRLYWNPLKGFASRMLGSETSAEDVVQEAFLRVWEGRKRWDSTRSLRALLYRITRNRILNEERRHKVWLRWQVRTQGAEPRTSPTPLEHLEAAELEVAVHAAIGALPPRRREVFLLARYHDHSYREIAEIMGISQQTVANQLSSAMVALRLALKPHLDSNPDEPLVEHSLQLFASRGRQKRRVSGSPAEV